MFELFVVAQTEIINVVKDGGPYALASVFAYLYWLERTERREIQKERNIILERSLQAIGEFKEALKDLKNIVSGRPAGS